MTTNEAAAEAAPPPALRLPADALARLCEGLLASAGSDAETARDATRAMMHASLHGVDSHGVRLLPHYVSVLEGGRVNGRPRLAFRRTRPGAGLLEADHAHGARATFEAAARACDLAAEAGVGAVGVRHGSHFGAAGAYALAAAERGFCALVACNSDAVVRLHDGAARFHGTNPLAFAAPSGGDRPWLLDMATSAIPFNRVLLRRATGEALPEGVASDEGGLDTTDARAAAMLAPLGGAFGFKGAGLAGLAEILSAVLTGMRLGFEIPDMAGPDRSTPRHLGAFVLALDPDAFAGRAAFEEAMRRYLAALRGGPALAGATLLAPGDREWAEAERRRQDGVPLDPETAAALRDLAAARGVPMPPAA